jgi:membrane protease YdiL (CAAX protease family)
MTADGWRRRATLAAPIAVPVTMTATFAALRRRPPPHAPYTVGFAVYWGIWCLGFPLWLLGPRRVARVLRTGRPPGAVDVALLAFPVAGAVGAELLPHRWLVDRQVAGVMAGTAAVNAVGEELLWRGVFPAQFPGDVVRGAVWPLTGFTVWHFAPQLVLPSSRGRRGSYRARRWSVRRRPPSPGAPAGCVPSSCRTSSPMPVASGWPASGSAADGEAAPTGPRGSALPHGDADPAERSRTRSTDRIRPGRTRPG